jgi:hypothetical protein
MSHFPAKTAQQKHGQSKLQGGPQLLQMQASGAGMTSGTKVAKVWWPRKIAGAFLNSGKPSLCTVSYGCDNNILILDLQGKMREEETACAHYRYYHTYTHLRISNRCSNVLGDGFGLFFDLRGAQICLRLGKESTPTKSKELGVSVTIYIYTLMCVMCFVLKC